MDATFLDRLTTELAALESQGLFKSEHVLGTPQRAQVRIAALEPPAVPAEAALSEVVNFCANNYLGLANDPAVLAAAHAALDEVGYGMASVRFICGTQTVHKRLERKISEFLGMDDTILYGSCFDANGGLFETLLGGEDAVFSDELNHASIIDGIRLCKARRFRYKNGDMADLERQLEAGADARVKLIATDGVFSMDGSIAKLAEICDLADRHGALVMVDDSHATGVLGVRGGGTPEHCGVGDRIDIVTSTLGKALGGASGGFTSGRGPIVAWLRQRSRPYLFSNTLAPIIAAVSIAVLDLVASGASLRERLRANAAHLRAGLTGAGFTLLPGEHPIIPVMIGDARLAGAMARGLLARGIYAVGFSYPVVPLGRARIRVQVSAAHERGHLDRAIAAFTEAGRELGLIEGAR
jgi:glycine C-acetyltransferase